MQLHVGERPISACQPSVGLPVPVPFCEWKPEPLSQCHFVQSFSVTGFCKFISGVHERQGKNHDCCLGACFQNCDDVLDGDVGGKYPLLAHPPYVK